MRNNLKYLIMMIGLLLFIVACSSNDNLDTESKSENQTENHSSVDQEVNDTEENSSEENDYRIISTTVAITEIMDKLELDLVGIPTSYKDLPERYVDVTEIGNPMWPDMEILMSLQPTNVLSVTTLKEDLQDDFDKMNVPASFLDSQSVSSMLNEIENL